MDKLTFDEYQQQAERTLNYHDYALANFALGLTGEAGEVADEIKKAVFHAHDLDIKEIEKELGDVMWYLSSIATYLNIDLNDVAQRNIDKLIKRYPDGFDTEKSRNREEYRENSE